MDMDTILELTWVPVICFGITLGYGILLLVTKNPAVLVSKKNPPVIQDSERYAVEGGKLMLLLALGSLFMCFLLFVNVLVAVIEIALVFCIFAVLWKKMSDKYGPLR